MFFYSVLAKDKKETYNTLCRSFFDFIDKCRQDPRLCIVAPQDLSSMWKSTKRGGAAKVSEHFCSYCSCTSSVIDQPRLTKCLKCQESGRDCFHWEVGDADLLKSVQDTLSSLANDNSKAGLYNHSGDGLTIHLKLNEHKILDDNIDFTPNDIRQKALFQRKVKHNLQLLGQKSDDSYEECVKRLRESLIYLEKKKEYIKTRDAALYPDALIMIHEAIPCILHAENRMGEAILKRALIEGFNQNSVKKEQKLWLSRFEDMANVHILGKQETKSNWQLATNRSTDGTITIADQTMTNTNTRLFMDKFDQVADMCFSDLDIRLKWCDAISKYRQVVQKMRQKDDFLDEDILMFDELCTDFYDAWLLIAKGRDGITNYIHMVGAGHFTYYLQRYRNLNRYSQQGWESLNSLLKTFFFQRTQRGGHGGKDGERNSKLKPIGLWLLRKLFWLSGKSVNLE
jgi:hypothetical protein